MEKAKGYLEHTELSLAESAEKVGMISDHYMIRLFKAEFGLTPGVYRKEKRP